MHWTHLQKIHQNYDKEDPRMEFIRKKIQRNAKDNVEKKGRSIDKRNWNDMELSGNDIIKGIIFLLRQRFSTKNKTYITRSLHATHFKTLSKQK